MSSVFFLNEKTGGAVPKPADSEIWNEKAGMLAYFDPQQYHPANFQKLITVPPFKNFKKFNRKVKLGSK